MGVGFFAEHLTISTPKNRMSRRTCENQHRLSIVKLREWGLLRPGGRSGSFTWSTDGEQVGIIGYEMNVSEVGGAQSWMRLRYRHRDGWGGEWIDCDYQVDLATTPCRYGGGRYWFLCPLRGCGRRSGMLYLAGEYAGCRTCYNLRYGSQQRNWGNIYSRMGRYFDFNEKEEKMRVKYWRGMPTKRYERLMGQQERLSVPSLMRDLQR